MEQPDGGVSYCWRELGKLPRTPREKLLGSLLQDVRRGIDRLMEQAAPRSEEDLNPGAIIVRKLVGALTERVAAADTAQGDAARELSLKLRKTFTFQHDKFGARSQKPPRGPVGS